MNVGMTVVICSKFPTFVVESTTLDDKVITDYML